LWRKINVYKFKPIGYLSVFRAAGFRAVLFAYRGTTCGGKEMSAYINTSLFVFRAARLRAVLHAYRGAICGGKEMSSNINT
jgi:hypothetical protein